MLSDAMQLFPGDHFSHDSVRKNRYSSMLCDYTLPHGPFPYPQAPLDRSAIIRKNLPRKPADKLVITALSEIIVDNA